LEEESTTLRALSEQVRGFFKACPHVVTFPSFHPLEEDSTTMIVQCDGPDA